MSALKRFALGAALLQLAASLPTHAADWVVYQGQAGPGLGKHIVFLSGDEEYRSEEALPMLARILAVRHGFKCTVLFAINPTNSTIDPVNTHTVPGIEALDTADLCVLGLRFREWPDAAMKHFVDYFEAGKPFIGLRTSTHAFNYSSTNSPYARFSFQSKVWPGGFGQQVLGETWINHHGNHGVESTRGIINPALQNHPILRGVSDIWGPTDVYTVTHRPPEAQVLVWGQVLKGMKPTDPPVDGPKNNPMMPLVWWREYTGPSGKTAKIVTTTMGAAVDLENEGLRRLLVNACFWTLGLEERIPARADVAPVGPYKPLYFGFGKHQKGVKPADLELR